MPSVSQVDMWFSEIEHIPSECIGFIEKRIYKERDSIPRNIPKAIIEAYSFYPQASNFIKYDSVEDCRFPVNQLWQALNILKTKGMDHFNSFCRHTQMPSNDKDRVITKLKVMNHEIELNLKNITKNIGFQTNTPTNRLAIQTYNEDADIPF
jgi:hypothetical protein